VRRAPQARLDGAQTARGDVSPRRSARTFAASPQKFSRTSTLQARNLHLAVCIFDVDKTAGSSTLEDYRKRGISTLLTSDVLSSKQLQVGHVSSRPMGSLAAISDPEPARLFVSSPRHLSAPADGLPHGRGCCTARSA
jgi:hypothetical protein